jgi:hypothetical protein
MAFSIPGTQREMRWLPFLLFLLSFLVLAQFPATPFAGSLLQNPSRVAEQRGKQTIGEGYQLIKPGESVGPLRLGASRDEIVGILVLKPNVDQEYSYGEPCPHTAIHWLDLEFEAYGLSVFFKNGKVFQIQAASPRFRTATGITTESSVEDVRRHYPDTRAFVLINSGADVVGGKDLVYLVDSMRGIAFEFYYNRRVRKRLVYKVIVFEPRTEFLPDGCVQLPQKWQEIKGWDF